MFIWLKTSNLVFQVSSKIAKYCQRNSGCRYYKAVTGNCPCGLQAILLKGPAWREKKEIAKIFCNIKINK